MKQKQKQTLIDFWEIKHQIDDEVIRLGWSIDDCKDYILTHYNKRSRLVMTDEELLDLLEKLRFSSSKKSVSSVSSRRDKRRSRRA